MINPYIQGSKEQPSLKCPVKIVFQNSAEKGQHHQQNNNQAIDGHNGFKDGRNSKEFESKHDFIYPIKTNETDNLQSGYQQASKLLPSFKESQGLMSKKVCAYPSLNHSDIII